MDTATRLWNSGSYISDKKSKAYDICYDERSASLPEIDKAMEDPKVKVTAEEVRKYNNYLSQCLRRQGV